jgi:hypothetical protein
MSAQRETVAAERKPVAIRSVENELPDLDRVCAALFNNAVHKCVDNSEVAKNRLGAMLRAVGPGSVLK